jgi:ZIP family zinc transporter
MSDLSRALLFGLLPFIGNLIGAILAESLKAPRWVTGAALHAAAGIAIALVSVDLFPRVLDQLAMWKIVTAFLVGAIASVAMAGLVSTLQYNRLLSGQRSAWLVFSAVAIDLTSDGLITGAGTAIGTMLGFLLAASQSVANIPGGFAAAATLRETGVPRPIRLLVTGLMATPVLLSALAGAWLLSDAPRDAKNLTLCVIAGVLLLATVEDVLPQGDKPAPRRWISTSAFALGFAGFALLASLVD